MKYRKVILMGGAVLASEILWYFCKRVYYLWNIYTQTGKKLEVQIPRSKRDISEVMFFTNESILCRTHISAETTCPKNNCPVRHLRQLESYMNQAKESLDVCMYMFTCHSLSNAVVNAHKRGVRVRIILDRHMGCTDAAQTASFHNNGVAIRLICQDGLMHHKFMTVDNELLITGSTNWTMSAFFGNFDHIIATNHASLVKSFVVEFDRLWKLFSSTEEDVKSPTQLSTEGSL